MATVVPRVSPDQAEAIALRHYGINGRAERPAPEHDDAVRIVTTAGPSRPLKASVTSKRTHAVSLQTAVLLHLAATATALPVQRVTRTPTGAPEARRHRTAIPSEVKQ